MDFYLVLSSICTIFAAGIKKKGFIMKAIMSMDSIYEMLSSLTDTNKKWLADHLYQDISKNKVTTTRSEPLSDEELAARLSKFPSWDEVDHADLSSVDYSNYKSLVSQKTKEIFSKWL